MSWCARNVFWEVIFRLFDSSSIARWRDLFLETTLWGSMNNKKFVPFLVAEVATQSLKNFYQ